MARISTYPIDDAISGGDKWIGSDAASANATKNFTVNKVAEFINTGNLIQSQSLRYVYQDWQLGDSRLNGSISFEQPQSTESVLISTISTLKFSKYTKFLKQEVPDFYTTPLIGTTVLLTQADDINNWAICKWDSSTQDARETNFYDIGLSIISCSGYLNKDKDYLVSLLQYTDGGGSGGDANFVHIQGTPSSVWNVTHNLDKFCSVTVTDTAGTEVAGSVDYISRNEVKITFSAPFSGEAFFN